MSLLKGVNISAHYVTPSYEKVFAVDEVSIEINENEIVGIAGESGCGKSTLLRILYGYRRRPLVITNGSVILDTGTDTVDLIALNMSYLQKAIWWRCISYIPQNSLNVLNPFVRVKDHFAEILGLHLGVERDESYRIAKDFVKEVGISSDALNAYPHQLSGGMRQRIVILLSFLMKPRLVLADEPTSALDVVNQKVVLNLLKELQGRYRNSLVLVSHDLDVHGVLTDKLIIMYAGNVVEVGNTDIVLRDPLHPYTKALVNSLPRIGEKSIKIGLSGQPPDLRNPPPGCKFRPRCGNAIGICNSIKPSLKRIDKGSYVACWLYG